MLTKTISIRKIPALFFALAIFGSGMVVRPLVGTIIGWTKHASQLADGTPRDPLYSARQTSQFMVINGTRPIVFLGDSRIDGAAWDELFDRVDISNRGISGDTSSGVKRRLNQSIPKKISVCVLQVGINDLLNKCSIESIVTNYEAILADLEKKCHTQIIVTSIVFTGGKNTWVNPSVSECNMKLSALASNHGAKWVDLNGKLAPGGKLSDDYSNDGLHFNGDGYRIMREIIEPFLPDSSSVKRTN